MKTGISKKQKITNISFDDDEMSCLTFEVRKGRFGFKLTAPYSEERRKAARELAKKENLRRNRK
ncbi:MAG: hypothetical protein LUG52_03785 [Clostridia bacterium]|nr:hypothetical protein [Clostridia bacterium]